MSKKMLQFGDKNTADIILELLHVDGAEYEENPLYLHSQVLRKCDFYETMLSERWSSDKRRPLRIKVTSAHSVGSYIKCIHLLYSSQAATNRFCFSSVDDALAILPVAAQLLFHECVDKCLQYLNAVRWTPVQEAQLRALLSSLQLSMPTELAARLDKSDINEGLQFLEESLEEMLSTIGVSFPNESCTSRVWNDSRSRNIVAQCIVGYFEPGVASSAVADICTRVLVKTFTANVEVIKIPTYFMFSSQYHLDISCSNLVWLIDLIRRCDRELFGTVFKMLSEDISLRDRLNGIEHRNNGVKHITDILVNCFLPSLSNGEIIASTSIRVSFISNWLSTMVSWIEIPRDLETLDTLETGIVHITETLPLFEQRRVFQIWVEALKNKVQLRGRVSALERWANTLRDAFVSEKIN